MPITPPCEPLLTTTGESPQVECELPPPANLAGQQHARMTLINSCSDNPRAPEDQNYHGSRPGLFIEALTAELKHAIACNKPLTLDSEFINGPLRQRMQALSLRHNNSDCQSPCLEGAILQTYTPGNALDDV